MADAELNGWLKAVLLAAAQGLPLPRWAEEAVNQGLDRVPAAVFLAWGERLGLASGQEVRQLAQRVPDLPAMLGSDPGQAAVRAWEAKHGMTPLLRGVRGAVQKVRSFWRSGGRRSQEVCRGIAIIAVCHFVTGAHGLRTRLAAALGCGEDASDLVRAYGALVTGGDRERVERLNRILAGSSLLGEWATEFAAKGGELPGTPRAHAYWEFPATPLSKEPGNGIRDWLFRRR